MSHSDFEFLYCPHCGSANLATSRWMPCAGKRRRCLDCEKMFHVCAETDEELSEGGEGR